MTSDGEHSIDNYSCEPASPGKKSTEISELGQLSS